MIYGMGKLSLASARIIGIVIGMYVFRIVVNFKKTSLRCLSYMSCKMSRYFRGLLQERISSTIELTTFTNQLLFIPDIVSYYESCPALNFHFSRWICWYRRW